MFSTLNSFSSFSDLYVFDVLSFLFLDKNELEPFLDGFIIPMFEVKSFFEPEPRGK